MRASPVRPGGGDGAPAGPAAPGLCGAPAAYPGSAPPPSCRRGGRRGAPPFYRRRHRGPQRATSSPGTPWQRALPSSPLTACVHFFWAQKPSPAPIPSAPAVCQARCSAPGRGNGDGRRPGTGAGGSRSRWPRERGATGWPGSRERARPRPAEEWAPPCEGVRRGQLLREVAQEQCRLEQRPPGGPGPSLGQAGMDLERRSGQAFTLLLSPLQHL